MEKYQISYFKSTYLQINKIYIIFIKKIIMKKLEHEIKKIKLLMEVDNKEDLSLVDEANEEDTDDTTDLDYVKSFTDQAKEKTKSQLGDVKSVINQAKKELGHN